MKLPKKQKGQILVLILLVVVIVLTIALSIAARSITVLKQVGLEESSARAFSAAEAGLEDALRKIHEGEISEASLPFETSELISFEGTQTSVSYQVEASNTGSYFENEVLQDEVFQIDLSPLTLNPTSEVYVRIAWWGKYLEDQETSCPGIIDRGGPALELSLIQGNDSSGYSLTKETIDHTNICNNGFTTGVSSSFPEAGYSCSSGTEGYCYGWQMQTTLSNDNSFSRLLRIKPWYGDTHFWIGLWDQSLNGGTGGYISVPLQGYKITSTGTEAGVQRVVESTRTKPQLPAIFDFVLFSGSASENLTK